MKGTEILTNDITTFLLVLLRLGIVMTFLPFFGSKNLPPHFRIGLIIALSLLLTPIVQTVIQPGENLQPSLEHFIGDEADMKNQKNLWAEADIPLMVIKETIFSFVLALTVRFIFYAVDTAGQIIATTMGLSMATVFNPEIGQSTEIARLYGIVAFLLFLSLDAHHYFIYAFIKSFEHVAVGGADIKSMVSAGIALSSRIFTLAIKLSAPVIAVVMITNILLGMLSKLIPQFNIFFVGYPIYITLGYIVMLLGLPLMIYLLSGYFIGIKGDLTGIILSGGTR
ncbi:MAG: flagellar biosynthetic protein FliR [Nitrospirota bacterium]|nr:flagellar biosynthetic protein FliR [Nitrospirota bacterium]